MAKGRRNRKETVPRMIHPARAEERLCAREKELRRLVELSPMAIIVHVDGVIVLANAAADELFEVTNPCFLLGKRLFHFVHDDYHAVVKERIRQVVKEGGTVNFMIQRWVRPDGSTFFVEAGAIPIQYGERIAIQTVARPITEEALSRDALRAGEERFRSVFEKTAAGIVIVDAVSRRYRQVNPAFERMTGYTSDELTVKSPPELTHPDDWAAEETLLQELYRGERNQYQMEKRYVRKDGSPLWSKIIVSLVRNPRGDPLYTVTIAEDISEKKASEAAFSRQHHYLEAVHDTALSVLTRREVQTVLHEILFRAMDIAGTRNGFVYLIEPSSGDLVMKIALGNLEDLGGLRIRSGEGVVGASYRQGKTLIARDYAHFPNRIDHPGFHDVETAVAVPLKSGERIEGVLGFVQMRGDPEIAGEAVAMLESFAELASLALDSARLHARMQDELAHRRQAEQERQKIETLLRQAQKMEAIGTLAGGIAHDFNNILASIMGYSELALLSTPKDSRNRHFLERVLAASHRARDLVHQILTFSRQTEQERKHVALGPIITDTLKLLQAGIPANIELKVNLQPVTDVVLGDPSQIHQVLMNLCANAYQAMKAEGGRLEITLSEVDINDRNASLKPGLNRGRHLRVTVSDTGPGISPEIRDRIFDPFFTTKPPGEGTGLGLAVVYGIVKAHSGLISLDSVPGKGTTFELLLPAAEEETSDGGQVRHRLLRGHERILLVDDEPFLLEATAEMLRELGYEVVARMDSREALETFRARSSDFDLVLTDNNMPLMNGFELASEIRRIRPETPIALFTGFGDDDTRKKAEAAGIRTVLLKPVVMSDLAASVRRVLAGS